MWLLNERDKTNHSLEEKIYPRNFLQHVLPWWTKIIIRVFIGLCSIINLTTMRLLNAVYLCSDLMHQVHYTARLKIITNRL